MTEINFHNIRKHGTSQEDGFEELCCQLFSLQSPAANANWTRKRGAGGDAGVEAYWTLPNGDEHALQAKYFFDLEKSQREQLTKSVEAMLTKHPKCTKYIICIPFNLGEQRQKNKWSQRIHWDKLVGKWQKLDTTRDIYFELWDETKFTTLLSVDKPEFNGRRRYWFDDKVLTHSWFKGRLEESITNLGQRYTPEMNVDLPLAKTFAAVRKSNSFWLDLSEMPNIQKIHSKNETLVKLSNRVLEHITKASKEIQKAVINKELNQYIERAKLLIKVASEDIEQFDSSKYKEDLNKFYQLSSEVRAFDQHLKNSKVEIANSGPILLLGKAGVGKSHILADAAQDALNSGQPAILILGQQLKTGQPWDFVLNVLDFEGSSEDLLGALDACAQAHGCKALFAIDALNEGNGKNIWPDELAGFVKRIEKFSNITLVASCRSTYQTRITRNLSSDQMLEVWHNGFEGHELAAAAIYMDRNGISRPDAPFLNPEFSNPLFLKTICETLKRNNETKFPKGLRGVSQIFDYYVNSITSSIEIRLQLDSRQKIVKKAINAIIEAMLHYKNDYILVDKAYEIVEKIFPSHGSEDRNLIYQLLSEGIISEDIIYQDSKDSNGADIIRLSYERYLDYLSAQLFIEKQIRPKELSKAFSINGPFRAALGKNLHDHIGFIEALSVQIPESFNVELYGLVEIKNTGHSDRRLLEYLEDGFKESLFWRDPQKTNEDTLEKANQIFNGIGGDFFNVLLRCASSTNHLLNATLLHQNLFEMKMSKRDAIWTVWISQNYYEPDEYESSSIWTLVDWAWSVERKTLDDEQVYLTCLTLAWLFCSPYRPLRDQATKAMAALIGSRTHIIRRLLLEFDGIDDFYVLERLYAVAYSTALAAAPDKLASLARTVINRTFRGNDNYDHLLIREYVVGIVQQADRLNVLPTNFQLRNTNFFKKSEQPIQNIPLNAIEKLKEQASSIYWSVMSGDFGIYIMNDVFKFSPTDLEKDNPETLNEITQKFRSDVIKREPKTKALFSNLDNSLAAESIESDKRFRPNSGPAILLVSTDGSKKALDPTQVSNKYDEEAHEAAEQQLKTAKDELTSKFSETEKEEWRWHRGNNSSKEAEFSRRLAKRWVVNRVAELGWTKELFEDFDRNNASGGRTDHSSERMGKKYQWIAYHELLAKLSKDNHYLGGYEDPKQFQGAWQLRGRDIDPSLLIRGKSKKLNANQIWWEVPLSDVSEAISDDDAYKWIRNFNDLPSNFAGLSVTNKESSQEFYVLDTFQSARQNKIRMDTSSRSFDKRISTAIIPAKQASKLLKACREQKVYDIFTNPQEYSSNAFIGEYPWHESWYPISDFFTEASEYRKLPKKMNIHYPIRQYSCETGGYDKSVEDSVYMYLPSEHIINDLSLEFNRYKPSEWKKENKVIFLDPASGTSHQSSALIDMYAFSNWLKTKNLVAVSSIMSFKQYYEPMSSDNFPGELTDCQLTVYDGENFLGERWTILTEMGPTDEIIRKSFKIAD